MSLMSFTPQARTNSKQMINVKWINLRRRVLNISFLFCVLLLVASFKVDRDPLHKRSFTISLSENKNGVIAKKVIMDMIEFKNGKLRTDFIEDKFGYTWIRYHVTKDSIYTDSTNTEVRFLKVEAVATDEDNQSIFIDFTTSEWDLDGTIKITRNDKLKKYYDMSGREKGGKPKKIRKLKKETPQTEMID